MKREKAFVIEHRCGGACELDGGFFCEKCKGETEEKLLPDHSYREATYLEIQKELDLWRRQYLFCSRCHLVIPGAGGSGIIERVTRKS